MGDERREDYDRYRGNRFGLTPPRQAPQYVVFKFTDEQRERVIAEARRRHEHAMNKKSKNRNGENKKQSSQTRNWLGCVGEMAVGVYLGMEQHVFASKVTGRHLADLPGGIEVKASDKHWKKMAVPLDDPFAERVYWHVTVEDKETRIHGWIPGNEVNLPQYVADPTGENRPAYFIPHSALRSPESGKRR